MSQILLIFVYYGHFKESKYTCIKKLKDWNILFLFKVWYNYDGKRYHCMCACVIFLFERSKVSHWPQEILREELAASAIDGFSHIPTDIMSWSGKLVGKFMHSITPLF